MLPWWEPVLFYKKSLHKNYAGILVSYHFESTVYNPFYRKSSNPHHEAKRDDFSELTDEY